MSKVHSVCSFLRQVITKNVFTKFWTPLYVQDKIYRMRKFYLLDMSHFLVKLHVFQIKLDAVLNKLETKFNVIGIKVRLN